MREWDVLIINLFWETQKKGFAIKVYVFSGNDVWSVCWIGNLEYWMSLTVNNYYVFLFWFNTHCDHVMNW